MPIFWYLAATPIAATLKSPLLTPHQRRLMFVAADEGSIAETLESLLMKGAETLESLLKIKIKNKKVISDNYKVAANEGHQRRLMFVATD
jgi:hypothetical protein